MDGCSHGQVDEAGSAHFTRHTLPPVSRRSSVSNAQSQPSCGVLLMTRHTRSEVEGAGQIQRGCSRGCVGGKPVRWAWRSRVAPTGSCALTGAALPRAGWAPVRAGSGTFVLPPKQGLAAGGEGSSPRGSCAGSERLGKDADIRTGSPIILAELSGAEGHPVPVQAQLMGSALPSFTAWGAFL